MSKIVPENTGIPTGILAQKLATVPLFSDMTPDILTEIAEKLVTVELPGGEVLVREGEDAESMYLLIDAHHIRDAACGCR